MKEIRRRAVSAPTDGFSEEISSHYLFIDRLDSFNLSEPRGLFLQFQFILCPPHSLASVPLCGNHIFDCRPKRSSERHNNCYNFHKVSPIRLQYTKYMIYQVAIYDQQCHVFALLHTSFQLYQSSLAVQKKMEKEMGRG